MPKPNYAFAKRQRDLAKKQKKEAKRQRKTQPSDAAPDGATDATDADVEQQQPPGDKPSAG